MHERSHLALSLLACKSLTNIGRQMRNHLQPPPWGEQCLPMLGTPDWSGGRARSCVYAKRLSRAKLITGKPTAEYLQNSSPQQCPSITMELQQCNAVLSTYMEEQNAQEQLILEMIRDQSAGCTANNFS